MMKLYQTLDREGRCGRCGRGIELANLFILAEDLEEANRREGERNAGRCAVCTVEGLLGRKAEITLLGRWRVLVCSPQLEIEVRASSIVEAVNRAQRTRAYKAFEEGNYEPVAFLAEEIEEEEE